MANCTSCGVGVTFAFTPPSKNRPEGANTPMILADVYWPANGEPEADPLPEGLSSRRTPVYEFVEGSRPLRVTKLGDFYIVRRRGVVPEVDISRRFVSHFATCPNAGQHTRRS